MWCVYLKKKLNLKCLEEGEVRKKGKLIIRVINVTGKRDFAVDHVESIICGPV